MKATATPLRFTDPGLGIYDIGGLSFQMSQIASLITNAAFFEAYEKVNHTLVKALSNAVDKCSLR